MKQENTEESMARLGRRFFEQIERFHRFSCRQEMSLNLNPGEMMMLTMVERMMNDSSEPSGVKPSELTGGGFISKPAVSRMIGNLEEKGYLSRKMSRTDRRVVYVQLTKLGQRMLEEERNHREHMVEQVFSRMGEEKMKQLLALTGELTDYAREELETRKKNKTSEGEQTL